jgi:hypothetical protein
VNDAAIAREFQNIALPVHLPADANGVYFFLPSPDVTVIHGTNPPQTFCNGGSYCGFNESFTYDGQSLRDAFVGIGTTQNTCCGYNMPTPHQSNGADTIGLVDHQIGAFAHELNEAITGPWSGSPADGQMGDLCNAKIANTYWVTPDCGTSNCAPAAANVHLNGEDFLVQTERVNASSGNLGYCATSYGGPFFGGDFGAFRSPVGNWWSGSYKGECEPGQSIVGLSTYTGSGIAHAVMCGDSENAADFGQGSGCHSQPFVLPDSAGPYGDWDKGFGRDDCPSGYFAAGVAQASSGNLSGLLCCPGTGPGVHAQQCSPQVVGNSGLPGADWDFGFFKATCQSPRNDQYVAGISAGSNAKLHAILCCSP